jgi:hypothetical protein
MNPKNKRLTEIALWAGLLGLCLRLVLYRIGFDDKNILSDTHPLHLICLALTALTAVYLAFSLRGLKGSSDPVKNFPRNPLRNLAMGAAAVLTTLHAIELCGVSGDWMDKARTVLAFACAASMALCALPGIQPKPRTVALGIITIFYALDMLSRYQAWSGNPQLPDYCFQIFAGALLSLCSYHRLAFATGLGQRRALLFCCLMGLFLCLLCAAGPETGFFYLGGACWAGSCLCAIQPPAEEQEETDVPA